MLRVVRRSSCAPSRCSSRATSRLTDTFESRRRRAASVKLPVATTSAKTSIAAPLRRASSGSPVIAVNRAVAIAETRGAAAGLEALDAIAGDRRIAEHQPYGAARADLLAKRGEAGAADEAYARAIGLERDPAVRRFLSRRRATLARA
jgi:predicted RNA polymerase sigma factor